jgi:hypothetical protein
MWIGGSSKIARTAEVLLRVQVGLFGSGSAGLGRSFKLDDIEGQIFCGLASPPVMK